MANDLTLKVGFDIDKFQKELNKTTGMLSKWGTTVQSSLMGVAAGFSALAVGQFVLDISKLAGEAEGVSAAFNKLPNSVQLMEELKRATSGTVSELELMKKTVMAANFGVNIEALPKLLEFAAIRAKQTGDSVEFLSDSIVRGIGRKSALILDNLGISLTDLNAELQKTPDYAVAVGNIASRELEKMGKMSENASTKLERLGASFTNLKVAVGGAANETGVLGGAIDILTKAFEKWSGWLKKDEQGAQSTWDPEPVKQKAAAIENIANLTERLNSLQGEQTILTGSALAATNREIQTLTEKIKKLKELGVEQAKLNGLNAAQQAAAAKRLENTRGQDAGGGGDMADVAKFTNLGNILDGLKPKFQGVQIAFDQWGESLKQLSAINAQFASVIEQNLGQMAVNVSSIFGDFLSGNMGEMGMKIDGIKSKIAALKEEAASAQSPEGLMKINSEIASLEGQLRSLNVGDQVFAALLSGVGEMATQLGQLAIGVGVAMLGIKTAFKNPFSAIAAGVALVALGKIVSNKAASISKGGGGGGGGVSGGGGGGGRATDGGTHLESLGERIEIQVGFTGDAGKVLKRISIEQDRRDGRTRAG